MTQWGLDTLFNPAKRHMDEEKQRLQSTREEVGDNSGGRRIDLESGKVVIRAADEVDTEVADTDEHTDVHTDVDTGEDAVEDTGVGTGEDARVAGDQQARSTEKAPSAAAQRAAARRGRTAR